jgi:Sap-like sulfolipid-1-addressing protein
VGQAIGDMLPSAVGVAISPFPIVAMVLVLVTPQARTNGPAFLLGWIMGIAAVGAITLLVAGGAGAEEGSQPANWVLWLELILGVLLLLLAVRNWRERPRGGEDPETPGWMNALDTITPIKSAGLAAVLAGINPKNLLLVVAGAAAIAQTGISGGQQAVALIVFIAIASIGVGAPLALYFLLGDKSRATLDDLRDWLSRNNNAILAVLFVVLGAKLIGQAIAGLT